MPKHYLSLDYEIIKSTYPLSLDRIEKWFLSREDIREGMKQMGTNIEQGEVLKQFVGMIIQHDPRKLYDVFDNFNVRIFISEHPDDVFLGEGENKRMVYYNSYARQSKPADSRIDAEEKAFMDAFNVLENQY